ncbi:hypothetical protein G8A07_17125 [Roseateles sp. DAIF2]|uniref:hypothetical protein n=1 Tax=Roseateles sp. DAIF2 TaxID=2714952 RepID=UPI0018A2D4BC|nr:hypothetical protein [Roseateles sp. DAIF2]QPF74470.1 hypothetical protein G8A07_17125 [Roseateles sp. DAIF2]
MTELRSPVGPVNLAATAKKYGISRGTLLKYIKEEPGLFEALQARRMEQGRGYVPVKRGTRKTRVAAKQRLAEQMAQPRPGVEDPPINPVVMRKLDEFLASMDVDERFQAEMEGEGRVCVPSSGTERPALRLGLCGQPWMHLLGRRCACGWEPGA